LNDDIDLGQLKEIYMSKKEKKKLEKSASLQAAQEVAGDKVLMRFKEHKFYTDLNKPHFEAGKVYELEGRDWINRWIKRGGELVDSAPSEVVALSSVPEPSPGPDSNILEEVLDPAAFEEKQEEQDDFGL